MKELLELLAKAVVDDPDSVRVSVVEGEKSIILQLHVAPDDLGKVIGKQGRIAKAIRTIVKASAVKEGKKAIVEIID
ncbi:MAG: KH domain-containing protein [Firmicutes bacterium]|nr:KH domain-containing protein [Bacillota bacterium]